MKTLVCYYCGKSFQKSDYSFKKSKEAKWLREIDACKDCISRKKADINKARADAGMSAHTGCKHNPETMKRAAEKRVASEGYQKQLKERTGKTLEEFYGKEGAENVISANKEKYQERLVTGIFPHSGTPHSAATRIRQSEARRRLVSEHPEISREHSKRMKYRWENYSEEEKIRRVSMFSYTRKTKTGVYKGVRFESTYELAFLMKITEDATITDIERSTNWITYIKPGGATGIYNPDFTYHQNNERVIIEVKPSRFLQEESAYGQITKAKIQAAKVYFNRARFSVVTEKDIGETWLKKAREEYAKYKEV